VSLSLTVPPGESSIHAATGTAAHTLGEYCLEHDVDPSDYSSEFIGNIKVTYEMKEAVKVYVDYVRKASEGKTLDLEQRVQTKFGLVKVYGTADACVVEDWGALEIVDYKNGVGLVEINDNAQLILYGIMAAEKYADRDLTHVKITIVQPNAPHKDGPIRSAIYSLEELQEWVEKFNDAVQLCEQQPDLYVPGRHCHWCRAGDALVCPAVQEKVNELAKRDFEDIGTLSLSEVKAHLDIEKAVLSYFKQLKAQAADMVDKGARIEGYTVKQGFGHRKWNDADSVVKKLKGRKFKASEIYEKKLISPSKAIKLFGEPYRQFVEDHSTRKPTQMLLVPSDDKTAEEDF
jgi:hypothetical protein